MLNTIILQGRLVADPEMKQIPSGVHLCSIVVASARNGKKDAEAVTDFIPCIAWSKTADFISKYFHKGDSVLITGRLQSRNYEDKEGQKRIAYEVSISEVNFCGGKAATGKPTAASTIQEDYESINWDEVPDLPDDTF